MGKYSSLYFGFKAWISNSIVLLAEKKKMLKVLNEGKERIEKELNIVKIMKSVRDIKILMKHSMMSPDIRF